MTTAQQVKVYDEIRCDRAILMPDRVRLRKDGVWFDLIPPDVPPRYAEALSPGEKQLAAEPSRGDQRTQEAALRYDANKLRYDLLPDDSLVALTEVYTKALSKYPERNWEKGMSWSRIFGSLMRHSWAFWRGERNDPETGCHHMAMAAWNCLALCSYSLRSVGTDDRPTTNEAVK